MGEMVRRLSEETFQLREYLETVTATHHMIAEAADNDFLADAMAPLQGLSRRFWVAHVVDADMEISKGAQLHRRILNAILAPDESEAKAASHALNDYLVAFSYATVGAHGPSEPAPARV
jgi:DNA-binding GntR family transcriptional regulator